MNATSASPADSSADAVAAVASPWRRVIDAPTRAFHWLLAFSFVGAFLTADAERFRLVHVTLGYTVLGLVSWRVLWGLLGPRQVRLGVWFGKLRGARGVVSAVKAGRPPWQATQNVLQAVSVVGLLLASVLVTTSGFALYNELFRNRWDSAFEEVHEFAGNGMLGLVALHLVLVLAGSLLRHQNQALTMITGRIPGKGPDLVKRNLLPLGVVLLIAVIWFWVWQWQAVP